jgi:hypothetical protein
MNSLVNPLKSALQFFVHLVGTLVFALLLGIVGTLIHEYLGVVLFFITFISGVAGSIKLLIDSSATP